MVEISRKFVDLHAEYAKDIMVAAEASVSQASPINPPVFWVSLDQDQEAFAIDDGERSIQIHDGENCWEK